MMRFFHGTTSTPNNFGMVLRQQGRVTVDADWNIGLFEPPIDPATLVAAS